MWRFIIYCWVLWDYSERATKEIGSFNQIVYCGTSNIQPPNFSTESDSAQASVGHRQYCYDIVTL